MSNVSHEEVVDYIFTAPSAVSAKIQDTQRVNHKCQHFLKHTNCIPGGGGSQRFCPLAIMFGVDLFTEASGRSHVSALSTCQSASWPELP